ncbi:hypothetical protein FGADI_12630 [Fusarium gaditjirri]|uniref:Uncharacterized protein n=1 Tax=Fusarium gaditjirri TaxID=282569 RepID=A0A8H4SRQ9_9HYPO|nr:hypothetical protein FGADI_12630 [Fusarium gaditjirri]
MARQVVSDSLEPQDGEDAETHGTTDYSVVHPETRMDIASFDYKDLRLHPKDLRVMHLFDVPHLSRLKIPVKLTAKYLSFASEADFTSYANNVLPAIVGPAIAVMASDDYVEKIREYDNTAFAYEANGDNTKLNQHLSKLEHLHVGYPFLDRPGHACPHQIMYFYESDNVRDWLKTLAALITEPKLIPATRTAKRGTPEEEVQVWKEMFVLVHAVQVLLFAPIQRRHGVSYRSSDPYPRRFPLGYPEPGPDDIKIFDDYSLDDMYRALLLIYFLLQQQPDKHEDTPVPPLSEVWLGYTTVRSVDSWIKDNHASSVKPFAFQKLPRELQLRIVEHAIPPMVTPTIDPDNHKFCTIQSTTQQSTLALRLTSRGMFNLVDTVQPAVAAYSYSPHAIFRMNLDVDTLQLFWGSHHLPEFITTNSRRPVSVRKLLLTCEYHVFGEKDYWYSFQLPVSLDIDKLPKLEEFSLIILVAGQEWMIEGLPRVRPQTADASTAHIGTKWQFNYYRYYETEDLRNGTTEGSPIGVPPGFCDDAHLDGTDPADRAGSIPYIGRYGYERSHGIVGGHWAGFKYVQHTQEAYFAPLSWNDVKPLVIGPFGENGTEALANNHTPQFVVKIWIIREEVAIPPGWIKVSDVGPSGPIWKQTLWKTWEIVAREFRRIAAVGPFHPNYKLYQTRRGTRGNRF